MLQSLTDEQRAAVAEANRILTSAGLPNQADLNTILSGLDEYGAFDYDREDCAELSGLKLCARQAVAKMNPDLGDVDHQEEADEPFSMAYTRPRA